MSVADNFGIAGVVYSQIKTMSPWAMAAWGAKELVVLKDGIQFKSSGMVKNKGIIQIRLNGSDLYDVTFGKVRKFKYKQLKKVTDVFVEDLIDVIDEMVG
jgi:hypothetical protein|tara:strand:- start:33 stop:332 length:300 start_codon:yes stop_codon:yes gene_type:complete